MGISVSLVCRGVCEFGGLFLCVLALPGGGGGGFGFVSCLLLGVLRVVL